MKVADIMTRDIKWVEIPGTRAEALDLMKELSVNAVPAVKRGTRELAGMVTLDRLLKYPDEDQLGVLIDRDVPVISADDSLEDAAKRMLESNVRMLPVLEGGKLVGIITVRDIVYRAVANLETKRSVADYVRPRVVVLWDGMPLKVASEIMDLSGFRTLPVIDADGNLVGALDDSQIARVSEIETESATSQVSGRTEGDSWTWDSEGRIYITKRQLRIPDKLVKDVMTEDLVTITRRTPVNRCAELMRQRRVGQAYVISADGRLTGVVRDIDLLRSLISS